MDLFRQSPDRPWLAGEIGHALTLSMTEAGRDARDLPMNARQDLSLAGIDVARRLFPPPTRWTSKSK